MGHGRVQGSPCPGRGKGHHHQHVSYRWCEGEPGWSRTDGLESKAQKGSEGSVPPMQCGMARSWLIKEGARWEIMWRTLMLINKRTKSSIEWLVYKPGLRRNSGFFSWWTTRWRVHNGEKKTDSKPNPGKTTKQNSGFSEGQKGKSKTWTARSMRVRCSSMAMALLEHFRVFRSRSSKALPLTAPSTFLTYHRSSIYRLKWAQNMPSKSFCSNPPPFRQPHSSPPVICSVQAGRALIPRVSDQHLRLVF